MTTTPLLSVRSLSRRFAASQAPAVDGLSLDLEAGEILALVGPSGCGKSTTLRMIAGLEPIDAGTVEVAGEDVTRLAPEKRGIGLVFQDYALFPSMSVADNIRFGARQNTAEAVSRYLGLVGLDGLQQRFPDELSGGQQQRVALARSLAAEPRLILLDEPFSNLDAVLRSATRIEIRQLLKRTGLAVLCVTHDQEEALSFADRIAVMQAGQVRQVGPPLSIYAEPVDAFVAGFMGRTNIIDGIATGTACQTMLGHICLSQPATGPVHVLLRPEALELHRIEPGGDSNGAVVNVEFKGGYCTYAVICGDTPLQVDLPGPPTFTSGDPVRIQPRGKTTVAWPPAAS